MAGMKIYEDDRAVSRADLAAWLRQLADQLDAEGQIFYGAAGRVTVADYVHCELEIEDDGSETSVGIEFSWVTTEATAAELAADEDDTEPPAPEPAPEAPAPETQEPDELAPAATAA